MTKSFRQYLWKDNESDNWVSNELMSECILSHHFEGSLENSSEFLWIFGSFLTTVLDDIIRQIHESQSSTRFRFKSNVNYLRSHSTNGQNIAPTDWRPKLHLLFVIPFLSSENQVWTMDLWCFRWWISHRDNVCIDCWELFKSTNFLSNACGVNPDIFGSTDWLIQRLLKLDIKQHLKQKPIQSRFVAKNLKFIDWLNIDPDSQYMTDI